MQCPRCFTDGITIERTGKMQVVDAEWAAYPTEAHCLKVECQNCGLAVPGVSVSTDFLGWIENGEARATESFEQSLRNCFASGQISG